MKLLLTVLIGILCTNICIAEETFAPFESEKANEVAQKFRTSYDVVYERLAKSMATSRTFAAKQGNIEEIKKIQAVLEGEFSQELTSSTGKSALKSFKTNVQRLCRDYASKLKIALKAELADGNVKAAEELQPIIEELDAYSKVTKYSPESFRVEAEKRWQLSEIEVEKGDKVTLYCSGTWTAYKRNPKQDADTNRLLLKVGDADPRKSGKNSEFIAKDTGKLSFCMDPRLKGKRHSPSGTLTVKVTRTPLDSFQTLHDLALNLNEKDKKVSKKKRRKEEKKEEQIDTAKEMGSVPPPPNAEEENKDEPLTKREKKLLRKKKRREKKEE